VAANERGRDGQIAYFGVPTSSLRRNKGKERNETKIKK